VTKPPDNAAPDFRLVHERIAVQVEGQEVILTATQFGILTVLVGEPSRVFSRDELVKRAFARPVSGRTVDVHIKELRRKLGPHNWRVKTVRGQGYRFLEMSPGSGPRCR
jgi:two-component system phosphate regulon response regulator PhoB